MNTVHCYVSSYSWEDVERESGVQLVFKTGSLDLAVKGTKAEAFLEEFDAAMTRCNIP